MKRLALLTAVAVSLSGCGAAERLKNVGKPPAFSTPDALIAPEYEPSISDRAQAGRLPDNRSSSAGSLFVDNGGSLFRDLRAFRVGDILTVKVAMQDRAQVQNNTSRNRSGSENAGVGNLFGLESVLQRILGSDFNPSSMIATNSGSQNTGGGQVQRSETVNMTISAVVTNVLPNGNFLIRGRQQTRVNNELRDLIIEGVVRPQDIDRDNSVAHTKIADAKISYGGKGMIQDAQSPRWGQQVLDAVSPF